MNARALEVRLAEAEARLVRAQKELAAASAAVKANETDDPGALSGIRRKPNLRADNARWNRYNREGAAQVEIASATQHLANIRGRIVERDRPRLTRDQIVGARLIRTSGGWRIVRSVNTKTVSVETGYSWTDRIRFDDVLEAKS